MNRHLKTFLKKATAIVLATAMMSQPVWAVSITGFDTAFTTNFNGWNDTLPAGFAMTGNGATYRGTTAGTTGGVYAIANSGFGWQASSKANTINLTGTFTNNTGALIEGITMTYDAFQIVSRTSRTPGWTVTSSLGTVSDLSWAFNSGASAVAPAKPSLTLTGLSIDPGATFTFTFASNRGGSTGSSPLIGLNNISLTATGGGAPEVFTSWNGSASGGTWQNGTAGQFGGNYANDLANTVSFVGSGVTVTTADTPQAGSLAFGSTDYTIAGTGLELGIGDIAIANAAHAATISAALSGTAITKSGDGRLVLSGNNTFTDATTVSAGVLEVRAANALGTTGNGTTVAAGASLALAGNVTTVAEPLSLNGAGSGSAGALVNLEGTNTFAGPVTLATDASVVAAAGSLTLSGGVAGTGRTLSVGGPGNVSVSTTGLNMGAGGQLVKDGPGTLTVSAAGNYAGGTTIGSGVVRAGVAGGLGSGAVSLEGGSLYGAAGVTTTNAITVAGGETVIAYWDFNSINPSAESFAASQGTGTISMDGWAGGVGSFGGSDINALPGILAGTDLALQGGTENAGNGTFIQIDGFSMAGFTDLAISFATRGTSSGFDSGQWSYSTDGDTFTNFGVNTATRSTSYALATVGATSALDEVGSPSLRYTLDGATSSSGNNRIDNLRLTANAVPMLGTDIASGTTTFSGAVTLDSDARLTAAAGGTALFSGIVSGAGGIEKVGAGTVTLSGNNTFSGGTTLSEGTLSVAADAAFGNASGGITLGGGTLQFTDSFTLGLGRTITASGSTTLSVAGDRTVIFDGAVAGSAALEKLGLGTLQIGGSASTYNGTFTLSEGVLELTHSQALSSATLVESGGTLRLNPQDVTEISLPVITPPPGGGQPAGDIEVASGKVATAGGADDSSFNRPIRGQGGFRKQGAGRFTIDSVSDFSGATQVAAGTLEIGSNGKLSGTSGVSVGNGARLRLLGEIGEALNPSSITLDGGTLSGSGRVFGAIGGSGVVSPGSSPGISTATAVDPSGSLTFQFEFFGLEPDYSNAAASVNDIQRLTSTTSPFSGSALDAADVINIYLPGSLAIDQAYLGGFFLDATASQFSTFLAAIDSATFNYFVRDPFGDVSFEGENYFTLAAWNSANSEDFSLTLGVRTVPSANFAGGTVTDGQVMEFVVVPEPDTFLLGGLGLVLAGLGAWRRRRASAEVVAA
jgi:fibronectin-binding autotransporter adhesin